MARPTPNIDLDAYLARIEYDGPAGSGLDTLRALHERHPAAIVFEAIDVLMGRGIDISPQAVDAKLIGARRGGYCFEHNGLFKRALKTLGFEVEGLAARVHWMQPAGAPPQPYSHMALRVIVKGEPWLADVGFGGCVLTAPLRFDVSTPQATQHETFRLVASGRNTLLQMAVDGGWAPVYELSPEPRLHVDFEQANWFTATHPDSRFRQNLIAARTTPAGRYNLLNNRFTVREPNGRMERRTLTADEIERTLEETYGLSAEPEWRNIIERAAEAEPDRGTEPVVN